MKKWITIGIVLVLIVIIYKLFAGSYNNMVNKDEEVSQQWAQVENQYQRRMDLIPNLVNTVKGYADFE
ncbi:MAG: LemA family protein, partial [Bacteroidota bacterium]